MIVVTIPNIDSKIWNIELKALDIVDALLNNDKVIIDLNHEGPCAKSLGLYTLLDKICEQFHVDYSRLEIQTANVLENHDRYKIVFSNKNWLLEYQHLTFDKIKIFNNELKHFGIFIGRSNWNRLMLASFLFKNFKDRSIISFHYNTDVSRDNCGFDALSFMIGTKNAIELADDLLLNSPLIMDSVNSYPILRPAHLNILKYYSNIFLDIVCETYFTGNTFFPTEKTVRPIISMTPFIVYGPKNYLSNLQKIGFKTFGDFWSEEYDKHEGIYRAQEITELLRWLSFKSVGELQNMYEKMIPILEHNVNTLRNLSRSSFYKAFNND